MKSFRCPRCDDSVFQMQNGFMFNEEGALEIGGKLPGKPVPVALWQCLSCKGYLMKQKEGGWAVFDRDAKSGSDEMPPLHLAKEGQIQKGPW